MNRQLPSLIVKKEGLEWQTKVVQNFHCQTTQKGKFFDFPSSSTVRNFHPSSSEKCSPRKVRKREGESEIKSKSASCTQGKHRYSSEWHCGCSKNISLIEKNANHLFILGDVWRQQHWLGRKITHHKLLGKTQLSVVECLKIGENSANLRAESFKKKVNYSSMLNLY